MHHAIVAVLFCQSVVAVAAGVAVVAMSTYCPQRRRKVETLGS